MDKKPGISRVGMLILPQNDIAQSVAFYQGLGLKLKFHLKEAWAELSIGSVKIGLCPGGNPGKQVRTGIVLEVADLVAFYAAHKDTVPFLGDLKQKAHGVMGSFVDPGGNVIDCYQPTPERVTELINKAKKEEKTDGKIKPSKCCKSGDQQVCS